MAAQAEVDAAPEWMRLLSGGGGAGEAQMATAVPIGGEDAQRGDDDVAMFEEIDVVDESDAAGLLAAVKARLTEVGDGEKYQEFLAAISEEPVAYDAAEAIIEGYPDLLAAFRRCFADMSGGMAVPTKGVAPAAKSIPDAAIDDRRGSQARINQLVQLVFANRGGHERERDRMRAFASRRAAASAFPRRLYLLRGPPNLGSSAWAENALADSVDGATEDMFAAKLVHVCSSDDFFMQFVSEASTETKYLFDPRALRASDVMNEARVRLAMEAGIEPLYVDNPNMRLFDMRSYVMMADRMGYVVTVVAPHEVSASWGDLDFLVGRNADRFKLGDRRAGRPALEAMIQGYEDLTGVDDVRPAIRAAERPTEDEEPQDGEVTTLLPPSAILYKFEKLLREGEQLMRYVPPSGQGWGVNGELLGEWHSFREQADGSCCYEDSSRWHTEEPEVAWSFADLAMLEDLRKEAMALREAVLPSATSHPALFVRGRGAAVAAPVEPLAPAKRPRAAAEGNDGEEDEEVPAMSRKERFRQRVMSQVKEHEAKSQRAVAPTAQVAKVSTTSTTMAQPLPTKPGVPTTQEETSAATFLAAVKSRLTEWGKMDQYHEFVCALSGAVDAKTAVHILRGHDDLLQVFRHQFCPRADLTRIKAELEEEAAEDDQPRPPSQRPAHARTGAGVVKQEISAAGGHAASQPHAPAEPPPTRRIKQELGKAPLGVKAELRAANVKSELGAVKAEVAPQPPKTDPRAPRSTVTVGDDSDDDLPDAATVASAARKGRDACIAELAKVIFRKERLAQQAARPRLGMVRYASKVAARPRFPREVFILRGLPGIGKTEYAMRQLSDYHGIEPGEELAARLTHVCSTSDFFEEFGPDGATYKFEGHKLEANSIRNETRVKLAMEAGIHPLFVDCANLALWEMRPYVKLAESLGYVVNIVDPSEINDRCDDLEFLVLCNDTADRRDAGRAVARGALTPMLDAFEALPADMDPIDAIRVAQRPTFGHRLVEAVPSPPEPKDGSKGRSGAVNGKGKSRGGAAQKPAPPRGAPPQKVKVEGGHLSRR